MDDKEKQKIEKGKILEYAEIFRKFDIDGNGRLSNNEFKNVLTSIGRTPTNAEVKLTMEQVDEDGDGTIDFCEFLAMMKEIDVWHSTGEIGDVRQSFQEFDRDGDGIITVQEFRKTLAKRGDKMSDKDIEEMIKKFDLDGDGSINFKEFVRMTSGRKDESV